MSVEGLDLIDRNEDGAGSGGEPIGTTLLQLIHKFLERYRDIYVRTTVASDRDDIFIEVISL